MSKVRTSPDKKRLSYAKDRRNVYGERGANSRFAIRNSKDAIERRSRHQQNQVLRGVKQSADEDQLTATENAVLSAPARKKRFYKMPDAPLSKVVAGKLEYRESQGMGVKKPRGRR